MTLFIQYFLKAVNSVWVSSPLARPWIDVMTAINESDPVYQNNPVCVSAQSTYLSHKNKVVTSKDVVHECL